MENSDEKTVKSEVEEFIPKDWDDCVEIQLTRKNLIEYDPLPKMEDIDKWTLLQSAMSYICTAWNNANIGAEEASIGNLYNAMMYLQAHCVEKKKSMAELI